MDLDDFDIVGKLRARRVDWSDGRRLLNARLGRIPLSSFTLLFLILFSIALVCVSFPFFSLPFCIAIEAPFYLFYWPYSFSYIVQTFLYFTHCTASCS